jgi:glycine cleavage system aminomethyltransferase T/glycine/D-amino acid oxidase-like deaminating enzyme
VVDTATDGHATGTQAGALPARARIVIIGGGVGGASVAHHLVERGERDVLLLERAELTSGSTFHSAGLVGQLRADLGLTRMNAWSAALYRDLEEAGGDRAPGWVESGSLRLASSPQRWEEIRRQAAWARRAGLPLELVAAEEAQRLFPLMALDGVLGAAYTPTDGQVDPARLCYALAASARAGGVTIAQRTRVTAITTHGGRVTGVRTDRGEVECEVVVDCGGMFAAEIARLAGVRVPIVPMAHQYVVTEGFLPAGTGPLPSLRDPDLLVYYRQELDGLVMGGYERRSAPWTATARSFDAVPPDFNGRLLPPDWDRFAEIVENAQVRVPALGEVGVRTMVNGPEGFTPDNEFCLGETEVGGFFVAAGFCAHGIAGAGGIGRVMAAWILDGDPGLDLWHMDVRRFGPEYRAPGYTLARVVENYESYYDIRHPGAQRTAGRPLRTSPAYPWHAAHGAVFGEKAGWERVEYYEGGGGAPDGLRPRGWAGHGWSPRVEPEHRAARETVALFDESSFAKIEISGPDAPGFVAHAFAGRVDGPPGSVVYTQALDDRGGVAMDVTVTRLADDAFLVVSGTASGRHDLAWLRDRARWAGSAVRIADVTGAWACFGLWGPRARDALAALTPSDVSDAAFPYLTMREITVGDVPVRALRVTYVGELGWELYCPTEYGAGLWRTLVEAGAPSGLRPAGYRAIESLRLEKGYRVWGADVGRYTTPDEAGVAFAVRPGGGYAGEAALAAARRREQETGQARRVRCLVLADPRAVALGGEPVRDPDGPVLGFVTSGGYGYTVARSIAYALLPMSCGPGGVVEVEVDGEWAAAEVVRGPLHDPKGERIRA